MHIASRRKTIAFFVVLGCSLVALAIALTVGWTILNWREGVLLFFGVIFFAAIIAGMILNTIFLVREIRRNEQHDGFINAVTHELKTPITSIRLYLETMQRREVDEPQRQQFYNLMLLDTDRLLGTVEQVLKAGEASYRRGKRHHVELDFTELVRESIELARVRHHLAPGVLHFDPVSANAAPVILRGDPVELRTAVSNLLDNAVKYSRDQVDVAVRIEIPDDEHVALRVTDRGIGIPAPELKRIFKRFYRVPGPPQFPGEGHRPGPVHRARRRPRAWRKSVRRQRRRGPRLDYLAGIAEEHRMSRVLVVEDEAHLAKGLRFNLEAEGHSVEVSGDGESALERLVAKHEEFDVVVLDVMLPGKDGFAVVSGLRKAHNYVPVLILTARGRPEDVLQGFAAGADDYLPKPFQLPIFFARLQGLLRRSQWLVAEKSGDKRAAPAMEKIRPRFPAPLRQTPGPIPKFFPSTARPLTSARSNCASTTPRSSSRSWKPSFCAT